MIKLLLTVLTALVLSGCATSGLFIDRTYTAKGQSSRAKFVVLHYTVSDTNRSINTLTNQVVSSHYLVTNDPTPVIYQLVDESRQANHAGFSYWRGYTHLNASSVGIEIVNSGFTDGPNGREWYPYPQEQVDKIIALVKDIVTRHNIPPENVIGHADIAPTRKSDPGPLFPWPQLAAVGLTVWPDMRKVQDARQVHDVQLPDVAWFQTKLGQFGYEVPKNGELDTATRAAVRAFQMRFRPMIIDGTPDAETAALLEALVKPAS